MRNTVIGLALALLFLAGLFALPRFFPSEPLQLMPAQVAAKIEPGFEGVQRIGPWTLACALGQKKAVPLPFSFGPGKSSALAADNAQGLGRCRAFIAFRRKADPKQVVMMLSFRLVGRTQRVVAIVRFPPIGKKGDAVTLRLGQKLLNLPVSGCEKGGCIAVGAITPQQEVLLGQQGGELLLPPGANAKRLAVRVPLQGLRASIGAMRRAQAGE